MKKLMIKTSTISKAKEHALFWEGFEEADVRIRFAQEVYDMRERMGISQTALAKECMTSQRIISNIENAEINLGITLMNKLSKFLNFTDQNWSRVFNFPLATINIIDISKNTNNMMDILPPSRVKIEYREKDFVSSSNSQNIFGDNSNYQISQYAD